MEIEKIKAIRIKLASPEEILSFSRGEVTKPETINYRTQRPERDGLFCEKIFGPEKDYQCYCGKYKGIRYKDLTCDRCGVVVTHSSVRREWMGHIRLAAPVAHIWFLRGVPSALGMVFGKTREELERVIYFISYIVTEVDEEKRKKILEEIKKKFEKKIKEKKEDFELLKAEKEKMEREVLEIKPMKIISELEYRELISKYGRFFKVGTGSEVLRKLCEKIDLKEEIKKLKKEIEEKGEDEEKLSRLRFFKALDKAKIRPEWMFLTILPVLPPALRPLVQLDGGRYASSDLNDLYRRVITRNNRLKYLLEIGAPEVIIRNEKRMLQEAVDALLDNGMRKTAMTKATTGGKRLLKSLADMLRGKQGRFRQNLLGKRVDYSGRSVIVVGPELKYNQVGIPKRMALEIFKPFVIRQLLEKELVSNVKEANNWIEEEREEVWAALEEVTKDKLILLNRAPTLHRLNIQAFSPILIEGKAIKIHPMICVAYNADFDGDQMAVFLPITPQAQQEARERMYSIHNLLKPATGEPILTLHQDIVLGCFYLTQIFEGRKGEGKFFASKEEAILAYELSKVDLQAKIKVKLDNEILETSVGRIIFNSVFPEGFPYQNQEITIKVLGELVRKLIEDYPREKVIETLDKIKELGFEYSCLAGITFAMDDLVTSPEREKVIREAEKKTEEIELEFKKGFLSKEEKSFQIISLWAKTKSELEKLTISLYPKENPIWRIITAGARGKSWAQVTQMSVMKGLVVNPGGRVIEIPVKSSNKKGFSTLEFFISSHGTRKGQADKALRTSTAGYLTRKLIDVAHEVFVTQEDCKDQKGMEIFLKDAEEIGQDPLMKILGRIVLEDVKGKSGKLILKKGEMIDWEKGKEIVNQGISKIRVRSPLSCKVLRGVCQKCYGMDLGRGKLVELGETVGIVAAQSIGEPGTQLTMRTFHYGGVWGEADITAGLPRVEEIFEMRSPSLEALISEVEGKVVEVKENLIRIKLKNSKEIVEYTVPSPLKVLVKEGETIQKGTLLSSGALNFRKLDKISKIEEVFRKMVNEVQKVYVSQGVKIHDKHIEIILRQMYSRVKIVDPGDSDFLEGEIVEWPTFVKERERLKAQNKTPPTGKRILMGISKVALTTESFLSAASFQETTRVLIKAALEGKEDHLRGLKENVILGRLIPAGTNFKKQDEE